MKTPQSICILRLSAIGDVCHTLAVVQAIQRHYPNAEITWIIGKAEASLLSNVANIQFMPYDKKSGWRGIFQLWRQLRHKRFDLLLNLQTAFRASILSLGVRAETKIGFDKSRAREGQWLFTHRQVEPTSSPHVLDGQMMFAKAIGVSDLTPRWDLPVSQADLDYTAQFLKPNQPTLLIAPCSSKKAKDWSASRYAAVANFVAQQNINVVICGSTSQYEVQTAAKIAELAPHCLNLAGKTNLTQLTALIKQVDLVLSSDSAPAHIATTQSTPVIGLYAIHNPRRTGPYCDLDKVISVYDQAIQEQYGKPWQQLPWATRAKGEHLMDRISIEQVQQKVLETLAKAS